MSTKVHTLFELPCMQCPFLFQDPTQDVTLPSVMSLKAPHGCEFLTFTVLMTFDFEEFGQLFGRMSLK